MKKVNILTKAQISTFIILGLLAFLIFGFIFHIMKSTTETIVEESTEKVIKQALRKEPITAYITLCLDRSLKQALDLIGKQGGYFHNGQAGSIIPFPVTSITYKGNKVAYLIEPTPARPPWYPCSAPDNAPVYCAFINNPALFSDVYKYTFGTSKLPFLYKGQGSYSIQEQLESYISFQTKKCANFTGLITLEEFEFYNITESNISAEIFFHENDVSVILNYPISIQIPGYAPITDLLEFKSTAKVRFRKIFEAVKEIIQKDNNFLDYDIIKDTESGYYNGEDLKFAEISPEAHIEKKIINIFDDLIIINDSSSKINGNDYIFQFARKNRYPVLDYINISIVEEGENIIITPKAKDPDEDLVSFGLFGEMADKFDFIGNHTYRYTPPQPPEEPLEPDYYPFNLSVSDSQLSDYQIVEIIVCDWNLRIGQDQKCDNRCGADPKCHLKSANTGISSCGYKSPYLKDECSGSCQLKDGNYCASSGISATCMAHPECGDTERLQYSTKSNGWCYGTDGCELFCTKELVDKNNNYNQTFPQADAADKCGCTPSNEGSRCYKKPYLDLAAEFHCIKGICK